MGQKCRSACRKLSAFSSGGAPFITLECRCLQKCRSACRKLSTKGTTSGQPIPLLCQNGLQATSGFEMCYFYRTPAPLMPGGGPYQNTSRIQILSHRSLTRDCPFRPIVALLTRVRLCVAADCAAGGRGAANPRASCVLQADCAAGGRDDPERRRHEDVCRPDDSPPVVQHAQLQSVKHTLHPHPPPPFF